MASRHPKSAKPAPPKSAERATAPAQPAAAPAGSQEQIRRLAYQKWEAAGRPAGDGVSFWLEAEKELSRRR
ncbi:MAG TPA: DUF2934 domain-containing protein [Gemmataceae bacterium]